MSRSRWIIDQENTVHLVMDVDSREEALEAFEREHSDLPIKMDLPALRCPKCSLHLRPALRTWQEFNYNPQNPVSHFREESCPWIIQD